MKEGETKKQFMERMAGGNEPKVRPAGVRVTHTYLDETQDIDWTREWLKALMKGEFDETAKQVERDLLVHGNSFVRVSNEPGVTGPTGPPPLVGVTGPTGLPVPTSRTVVREIGSDKVFFTPGVPDEESPELTEEQMRDAVPTSLAVRRYLKLRRAVRTYVRLHGSVRANQYDDALKKAFIDMARLIG